MAGFTVTGSASLGTGGSLELVSGLATSSGGFILKRVKIGQITTETLTGIAYQINRITSASAGSGGTAITPAKKRTSQVAAISTWLEGNTTKMSGTTVTSANLVMQETIGDDEVPLPDGQLEIEAGEGLQILLVTALPATTTVYYTLWIEE